MTKLAASPNHYWLTCLAVIGVETESNSSWRFKKLARRYAAVLIELLPTDAAKRDFQTIMFQLYKASLDHQVRSFLLEAAIPLAERLEVVKALVASKLDAVALKVSLNLVTLLIKERRINYLSSILSEFQQLCWHFYKISLVKVYTASALSNSAIAAIGKAFKQKYKRTARIQVVIQPELLAGIIVELEDRRIDNSLISIVNRLKRCLVA